MMWTFNSVFGKIFGLIFYPFRSLSPWAGMILVSFLTGLLMLFVFRYTSNQKGIKTVKNKIKAHLLELRLFKNSLSISFKAQGNILRLNLRYITYSAKPMLVMIVPIILILIQLNFWFAYSPLTPGQAAICKVKLKEGHSPMETDVILKPSSGIIVETPPLRIEEDREIDWRFSPKEKGLQLLTIEVGSQAVTKTLLVGGRLLNRISPVKVQNRFLDEMLYPTERPLPTDSPIQSIEITYPSLRMEVLGWHIHWLVVFFVLSIVAGYALKGLFKVEI